MERDESITFCTLDKFENIQDLMTGMFSISKSQIKKYKFNKNFLKKSVRLQDEISLPIDLVNQKKINPVFEGKVPTILFEDENLISISKPERIHCHPLRYSENDNLLSYFAQQGMFEFLKVNRESYDRGLMFRLDFETSGLTIFLKKEEDYRFIRDNFHKIVKEKIYYAVVSGEYDGELDLQHLLKPVGPRGSKIVADTDHHAETKFSRLKILDISYSPEKDRSLLTIKLGQGHRHQIRAQMRAAGFPLVGDSFYGGEISERLHLHCFKYSFELESHQYELEDSSANFLSEFFRSNS